MKGDFSRIPFNPAKRYSGVLHQQGRVWLDSDWNEDIGNRLSALRQELRDLVGPCGVPSQSTFQLSASADARPDNFQISGGHGYVNGILCSLDPNVSYLNQPDYPDAPGIALPTDGASTLTALVYLEVWERLITYLEDDSIREIALGGPDTTARLKTVTQVKVIAIPNGTVKCSDAAQFLPQAGNGVLTTLQPASNPAATPCQLPDPANFTGRENRLYRVEVHDAGDVPGSGFGAAASTALAADAASGATSVTLAAALSANQIAAAKRTGFVTIADNTGTSERVPVTAINAAGTGLTLGQPLANGYKTANQANATSGVARFKWSRDNASFAVGVAGVKADRVTVTLASLGRDLASALRQGDLVELCDDKSELGAARGHLTVLRTDPDPDTFVVQLSDPLPASYVLNGEVSQRHLVLRRWDGVSDVAAAFDAVATPGMDLGDGARIQFSGLDLRAGDYWQFAARAADGSVQALVNADPNGVLRSRCPLAIVTWGPPPRTSPPSSPPAGLAFTVVQDCRRVFPALVDFPLAEAGFHVNQVFVVNAANVQTALPNDTDVHVDAFNGLDVVFDQAPDPNSISRPTCFLAVDLPIVANSPAAISYYPINLAGDLKVDTTKMMASWRALPQTQGFLTDLISASPNERGVLMRLTLKGNLIWSSNNPNVYLDGEVYGQRLSSGNNTTLQLPSGDRRRGGDFQMWFWMVAAPSFSKLIAANPAQIYIGEVSTITVTLSSAAPAGSTTATVTSSAPAVAPVPATLPVTPGATTLTLNVTGAQAGSTTISVSFGAPAVPPSTTLTVLALPQLTGQLSIAPVSIIVGSSASGTVTLTGPAPLAGAKIALVSSNGGVAAVVASVLVAAGQLNATFTVTGVAAGSATITATLTFAGGSVSTASGNVTVRAPKGKEQAKETTKEVVKDIRDKVDKTGRIENLVVNPLIRVAAPIGANGSSVNGGSARAFIIPAERPIVEEHVLRASGLDVN